MINYSIIQKYQLEGIHRIDAEYFQPEYLAIVNRILKGKNSSLGSVSQKITQGPNPLFIESGKCCLNGRNVKNFRVDLKESNYVSEQEFEKYKNFKTKRDDILITLKGLGSIGKTGYVFKDLECIFSRDIGLIRLNNELLSKFIYAFLLSRYGSSQVERAITGGTGQLTLTTGSLKLIIFPEFQSNTIEEIARLISESEENYENSKVLYQQAEDLFLEELGLKDFQIGDDLNFVVNLSDIKSANRMDAEYFQPKYRKLINKVKSVSETLINIFSIRRGDFISPYYYVDEGERGYIRIKELPTKGELNLDAVIYVDDNFDPKNLETLVEGDFVFAGIGATLGKTAHIPKELEGSFYSNNTARFRLKNDWKDKVDTYYLQVVFQSLVCQWQFEQKQAQTAQAKIADEELKTVLIPILSKEIQQKIAELVRKSHEARKKSKELLEGAKRRVEEMIEKGGDS